MWHLLSDNVEVPYCEKTVQGSGSDKDLTLSTFPWTRSSGMRRYNARARKVIVEYSGLDIVQADFFGVARRSSPSLFLKEEAED